ncbi:MAG: hypothetical protein MUD12_14975 [Spirochaetes bacterium]|jgi:tetratricopeptide (TPR) repeat protein|nr:hypothetical protein [Spirochaetota bacterium]
MKRTKMPYFILFAGLMALSVFKSGDMYRFYLKSYHIDYRHETLASMLKKARVLLKNGEHEKLEGYSRKIIVLFPESREAKRISGTNMIRLGKKRAGADLYLLSVERDALDPAELEEAVGVYFEEGLYIDVAAVFRDRDPGKRPGTLFYYGASLYEKGKTAQAADVLGRAVAAGRNDSRAYYYLGLSQAKSSPANAAASLKKAVELDPENSDARKALYEVERKSGKILKGKSIVKKKTDTKK